MELREVQDKEAVLQSAISIVAKGSALLLLGQLLSKLFGFLRQLIIIRMLPPESYGLLTIGFTILNVSVIFGSLGLDQGAQRYVAFFYTKNEIGKVKGTIYSSALIIAASALTFMSLIMILSRPISNFFSKPELINVLLMRSEEHTV